MTLTFVLRGSDGLVLGADSRISNDSSTADTTTKFLPVNREIGILTYGLTEPGYVSITRLVDIANKHYDFSASSNPRLAYFDEIAEKTKEVCKATYDEFISETQKKEPNINLENFEVNFILAGYDTNDSNQFKIFHLASPNFDLEKNRDYIIAAQWQISQFLYDHFYYPGMNVEQLKLLAIFMLLETSTVSATVGGSPKIATLTSDSGLQFLNEKEIKDLIAENQSRFAKYNKILLEHLRS